MVYHRYVTKIGSSFEDAPYVYLQYVWAHVLFRGQDDGP